MNYRDWYCIMVASGCEKKAQADLLARKSVLDDRFILNVEVPESTTMKVEKNGKRKVIKTKVLPGYILVQVKKERIEDELGNVKNVFPAFTQTTIRQTANVLGFAGANKNKPRMLKPDEVLNIFKRVDDTHIEVKKNIGVDYHVGDMLDVISGPFSGQVCEVVSIQGNKILGQLDMFGRQVPAEFTKEQVYKK